MASGYLVITQVVGWVGVTRICLICYRLQGWILGCLVISLVSLIMPGRQLQMLATTSVLSKLMLCEAGTECLATADRRLSSLVSLMCPAILLELRRFLVRCASFHRKGTSYKLSILKSRIVCLCYTWNWTEFYFVVSLSCGCGFSSVSWRCYQWFFGWQVCSVIYFFLGTSLGGCGQDV
jgi:hypothetical protein